MTDTNEDGGDEGKGPDGQADGGCEARRHV